MKFVAFLILLLPFALIVAGVYIITSSVGWAVLTAGLLLAAVMVAGMIVAYRT